MLLAKNAAPAGGNRRSLRRRARRRGRDAGTPGPDAPALSSVAQDVSTSFGVEHISNDRVLSLDGFSKLPWTDESSRHLHFFRCADEQSQEAE